jgi:hypothetical protein
MWCMLVQVNCYSLNSVGPAVESLGGGKRFLSVYAVSALTSTHSSPQLLMGTLLLSLHIFHFVLRWYMKLLVFPWY